MKQVILILFIFLSAEAGLIAQGFEQVSIGPGYSNVTFYNIATGETESIANDAWDLAFSNLSGTDAGIFVNEAAVTLSDTRSLSLYKTNVTAWEDTIVIDSISTSEENRLLNPELCWTDGAFNTLKDTSNQLDYGWGEYNFASHFVAGNQIYLLQLRDESLIKIEVQSLQGGTYSFRTANLDGSNEQNYSVSRSDSDDPIIYFSLSSGEVVDVSINYDLIFARYTTPLDNAGETLEYSVTGVLSAPDIEVAEARGVDVEAVTPNDVDLEYSADPKIIGHTWKDIDGSFQFFIVDSLAYFVKVSDEEVYKLVFIDFEGSSTGVTTFFKEPFMVTSTNPILATEAGISIYPNPFVHGITIEAETNAISTYQIFDISGKQVLQGQSVSGESVELSHLAHGTYILLANVDGQLVTHKLVK